MNSFGSSKFLFVGVAVFLTLALGTNLLYPPESFMLSFSSGMYKKSDELFGLLFVLTGPM